MTQSSVPEKNECSKCQNCRDGMCKGDCHTSVPEWEDRFAEKFGYELGGDAYFVTRDVEDAVIDFIRQEKEASYQQGLRENCIKIDENFAEFLRGDGSKFSEEIRQRLIEQGRLEGEKAGRIWVLREVLEKVGLAIERHEDKGDERYGFVKHFNTILRRLEDDLRTTIQSMMSKEEGV